MDRVQNLPNTGHTPLAVLAKSRGVYPLSSNANDLSKVHEIFKRLIGTLAGPSEAQASSFPPPILEKLPESLAAWPDTLDDQMRLFAHVFSGSYLKYTGLEGSSSGAISKYLEKCFAVFATTSKSPQATQFFQDMIPLLQAIQSQEKDVSQLISKPEGERSSKEIRKVASKWRKAVLDQPEGVPYLIQGGWGGKPGHAMLYEFIRRGKKFELRVFDTAANGTQ